MQTTFEAWLAEAKALGGDIFDYLDQHYSFTVAFEDGLSPAQAVKDAADWLDMRLE